MGGLTNRSRTRMEHEDRSREPSVRRAPSRFVRRPGNPECGFARRPTFLFLPRSFGLLLVALSAFSPPFLGQESRKESGRCMHSDVVVDSGHELACLSLFFSLSPHPLAYQLASPRCSVRDIKSNFPPLLLHEKLQTFFFSLRAKNEETSSPLLPNWPNSTVVVFELVETTTTSPQFLPDTETKPFDRFESEYKMETERFLSSSIPSTNPIPKTLFYTGINFLHQGRNFSRSL